MNREFFFIIPLLLVSSFVNAEVVTIALPELTGDYDALFDVPPAFGVQERQTTLILPPNLSHIENMSFAISGSWVDGRQICNADEDPIPFNAAFILSLQYSDCILCSFGGEVAPDEGLFVDLGSELIFHGPGEPASFDSLLGAPIYITLVCSGFTFCSVYLDCYGSLTDVRLDVDGTVPTTSSTFGDIKALYR